MTDILSIIQPQQIPDTLYHYTTQAGLLGILQNDEIWATHTQYLNDQREYRHALKLVRDEIQKRKSNTTDSEEKAVLGEMYSAIIAGVEFINICVCSFSEVGDSLSQWRAYGGTAGGFAIGFHGGFLANAAKTQNAFLVPCVYELDQQRNIIEKFVDMVLHENLAHRGVEESGDDDDFWRHGGNLRPFLNQIAPAMKDPSFREEEEWRIISRPLMCTTERFAYRQGKSTIVPYFRFPLSKTANEAGQPTIREVVIGPTPDPHLSERSMRSLLTSHRLTSHSAPGGPVTVRISDVPYRNW